MSLSSSQPYISNLPHYSTRAGCDASSDPENIEALTRKYAKEKERRERADGMGQYVELEDSSRFAYLGEDKFVDHRSLNAQPCPLRDGQEVKVIILGAGHGGLLFAARLIDAGISPGDIRLIDVAVCTSPYSSGPFWHIITGPAEPCT